MEKAITSGGEMDTYLIIILALAIANPLTGQTKKGQVASTASSETSSTVDDDDNRPPLKKYQGSTWFAFESGKLQVELASLKGFSKDGDTDYFKHISDSKVKCKKAFDTAIKTVKKTKAKDALKNYHIAFLSSLQGIVPGQDELVRDYKRRQQAAEEKMNEAWARFEMEE
jgi:hypothetical protein